MRFVDKESSLLKTALTGKTRRFARTALFFKCLTRTALKFKRTAYKQSSQKKVFFKIFGGVDNLLTGYPVKRFEDRKFALFSAQILMQPYGCFSAWRRLSKEKCVCACLWALSGLLPYPKQELNDDETL